MGVEVEAMTNTWSVLGVTQFSLLAHGYLYTPVCERRVAVLAPCETGRVYMEQWHFSMSNPGRSVYMDFISVDVGLS